MEYVQTESFFNSLVSSVIIFSLISTVVSYISRNAGVILGRL